MEHICEVTVRSYELDQYGHVNNANYLNYLEYARHAFLNDTGFDQVTYLKQGNGLFVSRVDIRYLKPAYMDEILTIHTTCTKLGRVKGTVHQDIKHGEDLLATADVDFAMVNNQGRPSPAPKEILDGWTVASSFKK